MIEFNVRVTDKSTGKPVTNPLVIRVDPGLSGTVRNGSPANFYTGPPLAQPWVGDVEVIAAGYAPWSTGASPQVTFKDQTVVVEAVLVPFKKPFQAAPRFWKGQMCGLRIPGLSAVSGGARDSSLFLSWFYDRYDGPQRAAIRLAMKANGYTHWLLSWPDSRVFGQSPQQFLATCQELIADGFFPCPMLSSKDCDPADVGLILNGLSAVLPLLKGVVPLACIGWELSLWLSPTQVQQLIDAIAPQLTPSGCRVYVHFQEDYFSFPQEDHDNASFWNLQVGKLTGVLHQRKLDNDRDLYRARLVDCLERAAGMFNMPTDSGFGHPFDVVALEISAQDQFNGGLTMADGDALATWAIQTPPVTGPAGKVTIMGSGNGAKRA